MPDASKDTRAFPQKKQTREVRANRHVECSLTHVLAPTRGNTCVGRVTAVRDMCPTSASETLNRYNLYKYTVASRSRTTSHIRDVGGTDSDPVYRDQLNGLRQSPRTTSFMMTCLICGGDMQQDTAEVTELLREHGCIRTTVGSEGREFEFEDGERLEVLGMCNACDAKEIREYLESK